jgi:Protein of unknown function (DUF2635)
MAMNVLKVKLVDESHVLRRPVGEPKAGQKLEPGVNEVPNSVYWRRRLKAGEVVLADGAAKVVKEDVPAPAEAASEPKTKKVKE